MNAISPNIIRFLLSRHSLGYGVCVLALSLSFYAYAQSEESEASEEQPEVQDITAQRWQGSIMFDKRKVEELRAVYAAYQKRLLIQQQEAAEAAKGAQSKGKDEEEFLDELLESLAVQTEEPAEIIEEVLELSLNSILYHSPQKWSIWVNGERYSQDVSATGFLIDGSQVYVEEVNSNDVLFVWEPAYTAFSKTEERWEMVQQGNIDESVSQIKAEGGVVIKADERNVRISLRPNQSFVSPFMSIVEGDISTLPQPQPLESETALQETEGRGRGRGASNQRRERGTRGVIKEIEDAKQKHGREKDRAIADALTNQFLNMAPGNDENDENEE